MKVSLGTIVNDFKKRSIRRRRMVSLVTALSMFIASGVVWELRSVGITMVNDVGCGIEEHTHNESCYSHEFICDKEEASDSDGTGHVHDVSCFEEHLSCELEEHRHTVECYDNEEEYLLLNQVDEPEEMPVVEIDSAYISDDVINEYDESDTEDEISDSVTDSEEDNSISDEETENLSNMIINKLRIQSFSLYALPESSLNINTIYINNGSDSYDSVSLDSDNCYAIKTGDVKSFCITADSDDTAKNYFFISDENSGACEVHNTSQSVNNGKRKAVCEVTALKPGISTLCFDIGNDVKGNSIVKLKIKVEPVENMIYLVDNNGTEIPNNTTVDGSHYSMAIGDTTAFCIYSANNGAVGSGYQTFFYSGVISGSDVVEKAEENSSDYANLKRFYRSYKGKNVGKIWVGFDQSRGRAYLDVYDKGSSVQIKINGEDAVTKYQENSPLVVSVGQKFEVEGYDVASSKEWFYTSFDTNKSERVTLNYNNVIDSTYTNGRKVIGRFTALQATLVKDSNNNIVSDKPTKINFAGKSFYVRVNANEESTDKIYVITALGEREKDSINEYFAYGAYPDSVNMTEKNDDGVTYKYLTQDKQYIKNSEVFPYIIYVNETVELCHYSSEQKWFWCNYDGYQVSQNKITKDKQLVDIAAGSSKTSDGKWRITAVCKALKPGKFIIYDSSGGEFWLEIRDSDSNKRDHADIEITDGGFYEFRKEEAYTVSGQTMITVERYDTHVTGVNHCYLYKEDGSVAAEYYSSDYKANGTVGSTQYELTSKWSTRSEKKFDRNQVKTAKYDVSLTLIPSTRTVTIVDSDGTIVGTPKITNISGGTPIEISSAIFNLNQRSVIDAHNKCPDHSGLDFNVASCLNTVVTNVEFTATKKFVDYYNTEVESDYQRQYTFELIDQNGNVKGTAVNDSNGNIVFGNVFLPEGEYEYTIREKIKSDAIITGDRKYDQGSVNDPYGVFYDTDDVTYKIKVSNSQGIVKSQYIKNVNGKEEIIKNFDGAFDNEVVPEEYKDVTIEKKWPDGNNNNAFIEFKVYRIDENKQRSQVVLSQNKIVKDNTTVYENGIFYIGANQSWKTSIEGLPVQTAGHTYTYELEELNIPYGYLPSYDTSGTEWKIINSDQNNISISVKKEWYSLDGTPGEPVKGSSITFDLERYVKEEAVPVKIYIQDSNGVTKFSETLYAKVNGNLSFKVNTVYGSIVRLKSTSACNCLKQGDEFKVSNITGNASMTLEYSSEEYQTVNDDDLIYHEVFNNIEIISDNQYHGWKSINRSSGANPPPLNFGYSSIYNNGSGNHSLKIYERNSANSGIYYDLSDMFSTGKLKKGQTYKIVAYVMCASNPKLSLLFNGTSDTRFITNTSLIGNNWYKLEKNYSFPDDISYDDFKLFIETDNGTDDLYVDDVIIASANMSIEVEQSTGLVKTRNSNAANEQFNIEELTNDKNTMNTSWVLDCTVFDDFQLSADSEWKHTFTTDELKDALSPKGKSLLSAGKVYMYRVVETRPVAYAEPVYFGNDVQTNTSSNPIIIKNTKLPSYYLPATGGSGPEKYQEAGAVLIFGAAAWLMLSRRRKHKSSG